MGNYGTIKVSINIKSGTAGHYNRDNCDLHITDIKVSSVPNTGDYITIMSDKLTEYLVTSVNRFYNLDNDQEFITVYVIPA